MTSGAAMPIQEPVTRANTLVIVIAHSSHTTTDSTPIRSPHQRPPKCVSSPPGYDSIHGWPPSATSTPQASSSAGMLTATIASTAAAVPAEAGSHPGLAACSPTRTDVTREPTTKDYAPLYQAATATRRNARVAGQEDLGDGRSPIHCALPCG